MKTIYFVSKISRPLRSFHMASPPECLSEENAQFFIPFTSTIVNPRLSALHDDNRCLIELPPACEHSLLLRQTKPVSQSDPAYRRPVIRCLPASLDYDANYLSVDAHSSSTEVEPTDFFAENTSILTGSRVLQVSLKGGELRSKLCASSGETKPVILDNHSYDSEIVKISMTGLYRDATHINILEVEFSSQLSQDFCQLLSCAESVKISQQNSTKIMVVDCKWFPTTRKLRVVVKDFLSHVKIFYWKCPFIELYMELCDARVYHSTASDIPHPAFGIITPRSLIMAAVPDDNRILHNLPNVAHNSRDMHAVLDDGIAPDFMISTSKVACNDRNVRIRLKSAQLYSIIKEGSVGKPYPEAFETTLPIDDCDAIVLFKVFPLTSRSEYISLRAEVTAPLQASGQVTVKVTAFDLQKDERLGCTVKCTEILRLSDLRDCRNATFTLNKVMLHMFAFYKVHDVELHVSITAS